MLNQETRINATIAYFLLGPLFLLAKKGTPLAHPFVRNHAKRASMLIIFALVAYILSIFLQPLLMSVSFFGFSLATLLVLIIVTLFIVSLLLGAYSAYNGYEARFLSLTRPENQIIWNEESYSEETKIHIIASFLPFIGIFIAQKFPRIETLLGRKIGNFLTFFLIMSMWQFGTMSSVVLFITLIYIVIFAVTCVSLIASSRFFTLRVYDFVPTYHRFEAHIITSLFMLKEFFVVAFGGKKLWNYQKKLEETHKEITRIIPNMTPYWTNPIIIGIPLVNILTLFTFRKEKFAPYRNVLLEGLFLTLYTLCLTSFFWWSNELFYLLLFPFCTIAAQIQSNLHIRAPFTSLAIPFGNIFQKIYRTLLFLHKNEQKETITLMPLSTKKTTPGSSGKNDIPLASNTIQTSPAPSEKETSTIGTAIPLSDTSAPTTPLEKTTAQEAPSKNPDIEIPPSQKIALQEVPAASEEKNQSTGGPQKIPSQEAPTASEKPNVHTPPSGV